MQRREFLKASALTGAATLFSRQYSLAAASDAHVEILLDERIATVAPGIFGHFIEHLGGVIYDGVWVGENSKIPNTDGIRNALVEGLKAIQAPVIRWPGGCFADSYDWRDGIGPREKRPRRTDFWVDEPHAAKLPNNSPVKFDPNQFGTDDFARLCRLSGAQPYIAANLRSLPAAVFDQWVEYCNSPAGSTTFADMRAIGGTREPYNVQYWGIGNESWGCGGNFTPEQYASEYRRFQSWVPSYGLDLKLVASGPNQDDVNWTAVFFE
ncbi:MAG TPA: alpha-L-arabinofuranosidase, partial [Silvibacterium sp.]|nr:alpha-L-arabinofuranosidase [Silvibacterium sp.]